MAEKTIQNPDIIHIINQCTVSEDRYRHMHPPIVVVNMAFFKVPVNVARAKGYAAELREWFDIPEIKEGLSFTHVDLANAKPTRPETALRAMAVASIAGIIRLENLTSPNQVMSRHGGFRAYFNDSLRKESN